MNEWEGPEGPFHCDHEPPAMGKRRECGCYSTESFQSERTKNLRALDSRAIAYLREIIVGYPARFDSEAYRALFTAIAARHDVKMKDVAMAARLAIMGRPVGMPLFEGMALLGPTAAIKRMEDAIEIIGGTR